MSDTRGAADARELAALVDRMTAEGAADDAIAEAVADAVAVPPGFPSAYDPVRQTVGFLPLSAIYDRHCEVKARVLAILAERRARDGGRDGA